MKKFPILLSLISVIFISCSQESPQKFESEYDDPLAPYMYVGTIHNYFLEQTAVALRDSCDATRGNNGYEIGDWEQVSILQKDIIAKSEMPAEEKAYSLESMDTYKIHYNMDFLIEDFKTTMHVQIRP